MTTADRPNHRPIRRPGSSAPTATGAINRQPQRRRPDDPAPPTRRDLRAITRHGRKRRRTKRPPQRTSINPRMPTARRPPAASGTAPSKPATRKVQRVAQTTARANPCENPPRPKGPRRRRKPTGQAPNIRPGIGNATAAPSPKRRNRCESSCRRSMRRGHPWTMTTNSVAACAHCAACGATAPSRRLPCSTWIRPARRPIRRRTPIRDR